MTHIDHLLDGFLVAHPVLEENARRAWHNHHEGIAGLDVEADGILWCAGAAIFSVVVLDKGYRVAAIVGILVQGPAIGREVAPFVVIHRITYHIAEGEVERGTLYHAIYLGAVNPVLHCTDIAIPILTHRVGGL